MDDLLLDVFFENPEDLQDAERFAAGLQIAVKQLAPHITLEIVVSAAERVEPWTVSLADGDFTAALHAPSDLSRESLLLTSMALVHYGYGKSGRCVVSLGAARSKESRGGDPVDILIHEWIHTLVGKTINGRTVPFVDDAEKYGYQGTLGADGEPRWDDWNRRCLGGPGPPE